MIELVAQKAVSMEKKYHQHGQGDCLHEDEVLKRIITKKKKNQLDLRKQISCAIEKIT